MDTREREAFDAWVYSMSCNANITEEAASEIIAGWLKNGRETEVRNIVTLKFEPHTIRYVYKDGHYCPGYYDCLRCAG